MQPQPHIETTDIPCALQPCDRLTLTHFPDGACYVQMSGDAEPVESIVLSVDGAKRLRAALTQFIETESEDST